jgi:hypothetical protein
MRMQPVLWPGERETALRKDSGTETQSRQVNLVSRCRFLMGTALAF